MVGVRSYTRGTQTPPTWPRSACVFWTRCSSSVNRHTPLAAALRSHTWRSTCLVLDIGLISPILLLVSPQPSRVVNVCDRYGKILSRVPPSDAGVTGVLKLEWDADGEFLAILQVRSYCGLAISREARSTAESRPRMLPHVLNRRLRE